MKKIAIILLTLLLLTSCNNDIEKQNVNMNIYPYLEFELSPTMDSFVVSVVEGAKLETVQIPSQYHTDFGAMPVSAFMGFKNKEDAQSLKKLILDSNIKLDNAFYLEEAENLKSITYIQETTIKVSDLPVINQKGKHFIGWKLDGKLLEEDALVKTTVQIEPDYEDHELVHYSSEATCTTPGTCEYYVCTYPACSGLYFADNLGLELLENIITEPAVGHNSEYIKGIEATCTQEGLKEHYKCTRCNLYFSDKECKNLLSEDKLVLPKKDHNLTVYEEKDSTCTEKGHEKYSQCTECNKLFDKENNEIEEKPEKGLLEHNIDTVSYKHDSKSHWNECTNCHSKHNIKEHDYSYKAEETDKPEVQKITYTCKTCNYSYTTEYLTGAHEQKLIETKPSTCTEDGYEIWECICHNIQIKKTIPSTGHKVEKQDKKDATCTEEGIKEHYKCKVCNKLFLYESATEEVTLESLKTPKKEHTYSAYKITEEGHYKECTVCHTKTEIEEHNYNQEIINNNYLKNIADCLNAETYYKSCICSKQGTETFTTKEALGHKIEHKEEQDSTCKEPGHKEHYVCTNTNCPIKYSLTEIFDTQADYKKDIEIAIKEHIYDYKSDENGHIKYCTIGNEEQAKEPHQWAIDNLTCEICNYRKVTGEGGFKPTVIDKKPEAEVTYAVKDNTYTFTLTDKYPNDARKKIDTTKIQWMVDNIVQESGTTELSFTITEKRNYKITCFYYSDSDGNYYHYEINNN